MVADFSLLPEVEDYCLSEISDFASLLQRANAVNKPVFDLSDEDMEATGVVRKQMVDSKNRFNEIFKSIIQKMEKLIS